MEHMEDTNEKNDQRNHHDNPKDDDSFAGVGEDEIQVEGTPPLGMSGTATSIPVDFETPSIHMDQGGVDEEDVFAKLVADEDNTNAQAEGGVQSETGVEGESSSEPIQLVEQAANALFDSLGVEHYDPNQASPVQAHAADVQELDIHPATYNSETTDVGENVNATSISIIPDTLDTAADHSDTIPKAAIQPDEFIAPSTDTVEESTPDVFDTLATSEVHDQPSGSLVGRVNESEQPQSDARGIELDDEDDTDDVFATLASGNVVHQAETTEDTKPTSAPVDNAASTLDVVETEDDDVFANIGAADNNVEEQVSQGAGENGDSAEEQERKYRLLLEEFGGEDGEFLPESQATHQAATLFGDDSESTPFDVFNPSSSEYPQTASSSTTPPPNLSIENSLQDIEPYEGDESMVTDTSDWLGDTSMGADQSIQMEMHHADAQGSSHLEFEVPYGWYEGDTFHYYTDEQREQVRLAMMDGRPPVETTSQSASQSQDHSSTPLQAPVALSGFSENSARRTPNPESRGDPYAPSSSRQPVTAASSYFGDSQYTASTATTNPYASVSSKASPVQPYDPYAPATPSAAPFDPYAEVVPAKQPIYYGNQKKPSALGKSGPAAVSQRPAAPQRVASTAYDPPFLRPQKSFARPPSAVPVASAAYGVPPLPSPLAAPTPPPPAAPPSGPPRRSTTPYAPPPPIVDRPARQPTPVQSAYAPEEYVAPPAPIAPAGPPRGPPSRPSSSMSSARQAQRAPSYNSFDPPLRTQTLSRASMKASLALAPPSHSPSAPSLAISPPTASVSQFIGSRPPSRAAPGYEAPPTGPPRPPSRTAPGYEAPQTEPPRPSSRAASGYEAAPPAGPTRAPGRTPGPTRGPIPSFQPPPRLPSASHAHESSRASPIIRQEELESDVQEEDRYEHRRERTPPSRSYDIPQLHSGQEEPDEEGGAWDEGVEDDEFTRNDHPGEPPRHDYEAEREVHDEPQNTYDAPPSHQPRSIPSQSGTSYAPAPANGSYDPYGPSQRNESSGRSDSYQAQASYAPVSAPTNTASYDPYNPEKNVDPISQQRSEAYQPEPNYAAPQPPSSYSPEKAASYDPYGSGQSQYQTTQQSAPYNPYAPNSTSPRASLVEPSSLGLSSLGSSIQQNSYDSPYASARPAAEQYTPGADTHLGVASPGYGTDYGTSPPANNYFSALPPGPADQTYTPQQVLDQRPVSEDPLGRSTLAARNAPIAIFGFGGVLISAFPGIANAQNEAAGGHARTASYGYASGRGQLWIRSVSDLVSESALKSNETVFPGPLVLDPSSVKGSAGDKKKKEAVLEYLKARVEETEKGLPYLKTSANATRREQEGKLALLRLLLAMVIGEGKLTGSTQVEDAVRIALQNPLEPSSGSNTFSPTSATGPVNGFSTSLYQGTNQNAPPAAASPSQLSQLSTMLSNGDKREAALYAASNGLWSHALLISSNVDQDFWREMVTRFSGAELHSGLTGSAGLKASYTLFAGVGPTAIDDLFTAARITDDPSSDQWREVIGAVLFNGKPTDLAYLDELGARLTSAGLVNAGHVCSLLSPTSAFGDLTPGAQERPIPLVQSTRDEDAVVFAEIAEYARSLIPVPKGQELPFPGLPQLLPYKLHRAWWAAELGDHDQAKRYCKAVEAASKVGKSGVSLLSRPYLNSLEDLQERLTGEPSIKPANLIGGRKAGKPGVNKLGSWIEGRLTKFIAGEEDTEGPIKATPPTKGKESSGAPVGPFSHFSTISPGPSNPVTRAASTADFGNGQYGGRLSPAQGGGHQPSSSSSSSTHGEQYGTGAGYGGYNPYSGGGDDDQTGENEDTPHALEPAGDSGEVELLNPMAALSLGPTRQAQDDYGPPKTRPVEEEEDEDDLGFGNTSLSRTRTPKPAEGGDDKGKKKETAPAKAATPEPSIGAKNEQKSGWLRGWFGKKEGEGSGPIVAKLGEESSMIFDPELKRWIVKGAKPEPTAAAPPPPPPSRPQSAAPVSRANSATPPSSLSRSTGSGSMPPSRGFTEMPDGGIKRQKSSLAESVTPSGPTPPPGGAGGPPRPPSGPPKPPGSSIDDLLSRPPSKRPASAARKGVKNRYVDVFQGEGNK